MFILLGTVWSLPARWPRKVKAHLALLAVVVAGYNLYLARVSLVFLGWGLLAATLPIALWVALRRWTTWVWAKSPWAGFGLVAAGSAIGLCLLVRFGA